MDSSRHLYLCKALDLTSDNDNGVNGGAAENVLDADTLEASMAAPITIPVTASQ